MIQSEGRRGLWVCTRCVRRSIEPRQQRRISFFSASASSPSASFSASPTNRPVDHARSNRHDDTALRSVFDAPSGISFPEFGLKKSQGLFLNRYLTGPAGFTVFAQRNIQKATKVVDRVLKASTTREYQAIVRDLDRLSDLLCRVLDLSDFVRMTHPDPAFQDAATNAWNMVYIYMNELNTMTGLNDQLGIALANPEVTNAWSEEEMTVAKLLKLDFMKSAVNLPQTSRDRFVELSSRISEVGSAFVQGMEPEKKGVTLPSHRFYGLYPSLAATLKVRSQISIPTMGSEAAAALQSVYDEETRRELYLAQRRASKRTIKLLESMLKLRAELAGLAGFQSHGHMALKERMMAKSPSSVMQFLLALREHNRPMIESEFRELTDKKRERLSVQDMELRPWDRDFYMEKIRADMRSRVRHDDQLAAYFSVGTVMQGLSRLFERLYGIRFVSQDTQPGETWHPDVKRLNVVSDGGELVAVLYCDLFYRPQKFPNPAHFTVRCSREILPSELEEAAAEMGDGGVPAFDTVEQAANDGMETSSEGNMLKQLPTIALVCDFPKNDNAREPAFLSFHSVETLFHEMGHAIHSILARTSFQNVSGTRCATDFAELPSTLMEHFAADPTVLSLFARHWKTDQPLPYDLVAERIRLAKRFEGIDTEHQILLAMVDQAYHSPLVSDPSFDSTAVFHDIQDKYAHGPAEPRETCWQGFFGHLNSYGSTYYSYLFDRVLAERVWRVVFGAGGASAIDRENGEHLKENLLKWGGGRDAWVCLSETLRDERLAPGDEKSMALVGSWGIKDDIHKS